MPHAIDDVPWSGRPEFVVGLDIGTAHSSVTFSRLEPGKVPLLERMTHWPSAAGFGGTDEAKTASKLFYDKHNRMRVAGAEVYTPGNRHAARDNDWHLVRNFKLLLHPPAMVNCKGFKFEVLPNGLTIETVYADMIRYMLEHTRQRIDDRPDIGTWAELSQNMTLVIAHPNGWGTEQQARIRAAVVMSGFFGQDGSAQRVRFVAEAEASVHYILWKQFKSIKPGDQFIICDAGGSTVDTTTYIVLSEAEDNEVMQSNNFLDSDAFAVGKVPVGDAKSGISARLTQAFRKSTVKAPRPRTSAPPIRLREIKVSDCQPAGGIFVNEAFVKHLRDTLYTQPPNQQRMVEQFIQKGEENFELHCKREFTVGPGSQPYYVVEAGVSLPDNPDDGRPRHKIARLRALACTASSTYSSLEDLALANIYDNASKKSSDLGAFNGKAASDGSLIWYIKQRVVGRAARRSFGLKIMEAYNPNITEHRLRSPVKLANGVNHVMGKWSLIIERGQMVDKKFAVKKSYERMYASPDPDLGQFTVALYAWANERAPPPEWVMDPDENMIDGFELICFISANINALQGALRKDQNADSCWRLDFTLCIEFDGVELKARIEWVEK
ncbi:hypothetical protein FRC11_007557, partial [Ceratobasidium sp. 423]